MARLSYKARKKLPTKDFAEPGKKAYPIEDKAHARNALARVSQFGSPAEKAKVRGAVHRKFPSIDKAKGKKREDDEYRRKPTKYDRDAVLSRKDME